MLNRGMPLGAFRANNYPQYPVEVLNRVALVFGMRSYMLGERFLRRPGLIVSIVDNDPQPFPRRRD
jgi:hypothetical protein